jgi:hypothetical protein
VGFLSGGGADLDLGLPVCFSPKQRGARERKSRNIGPPREMKKLGHSDVTGQNIIKKLLALTVQAGPGELSSKEQFYIVLRMHVGSRSCSG